MADPFIGEIKLAGFDFAPRGWAFCNGQLLPISQNQALFSLLGTMYGGNGQTTFALPDLRSRVALHVGASYTQGQSAGEAAHTLLVAEMPTHSHVFAATTAAATVAAIGGATRPGRPTAAGAALYTVGQAAPNPALIPQTMAAGSIAATGGNSPHNNMMPYLGLTFIIALQGIFPSRS